MSHVPEMNPDCSSSTIVTGAVCGRSPEVLRIYGLLYESREVYTHLSRSIDLAIDYARAHLPCVILAEARMLRPGESVDLNLQLLRRESIQILIITRERNEDELKRLLRLGYAGFVDPFVSGSELEEALTKVNAGEIWASRRVISGALQDTLHAASHASKLTSRESEILKHIAAGHDNQWIAEQLFITRDTVRWHLRSAYAKLGIHDRRQVARCVSVGE
jgi:DNA-binding NarL/FixJ family response regulator